MSWLANNQVLVGCIEIGVGTIIVALAGLLKSKGDKALTSRKKEESSRSWRYYLGWILVLIIGASTNVLGTWTIKSSSDAASLKQSEKAERTLRETREEGTRAIREAREDNARVEREFREKFQAVLTKLNAAKQEDSKRITEEKIRVIQSDLSSWAELFATNLPSRRSEFAKLKADFEKSKIERTSKEIQRQVQLSGQAYPVLSFAARYVEAAIKAYAVQTGRTNKIRVIPIELAENFYEKPISSEIQIDTNVVWRMVITTAGRLPGVPPYVGTGQLPYLRILFSNSQGEQSGVFGLLPKPDAQKLWVSYSASLPVPDLTKVSGERDLTNYETVVRESLQPVIEAQLLQLDER